MHDARGASQGRQPSQMAGPLAGRATSEGEAAAAAGTACALAAPGCLLRLLCEKPARSAGPRDACLAGLAHWLAKLPARPLRFTPPFVVAFW